MKVIVVEGGGEASAAAVSAISDAPAMIIASISDAHAMIIDSISDAPAMIIDSIEGEGEFLLLLHFKVLLSNSYL